MSLRSLQIGGGGGLQAATLLTELLLMLSRRSKRAFNLPPCLPSIERVTALKSQDTRCHDYWKAVYERTHARRRPQVCAVATHHQSSALPRHERPGSARRLPVSRYSSLRPVGLYSGRRS